MLVCSAMRTIAFICGIYGVYIDSNHSIQYARDLVEVI